MSDSIKEKLINNSAVTPLPAVLDQYKLYVESANQISTRRLTANSFFLTINTGLAALIGYLIGKQSVAVTVALLGVPIAGMVLCYVWFRQIRSYRDLNEAKFKVIHIIEESLPFRMFDAEWEALGRGENSKNHKSFSDTEKIVPWVFFGLHAVMACLILQAFLAQSSNS